MKRSFERFIAKLDSLGLRKTLEKRAASHHVSLFEIYQGARTPSIVAARRGVYVWLSAKESKGINEIARIFDRSASGVSKLMQAKEGE